MDMDPFELVEWTRVRRIALEIELKTSFPL